MIKLNDNFKPAPSFKWYNLLEYVFLTIVIGAFVLFIYSTNEFFEKIYLYAGIGVVLAVVIFIVFWNGLYYKSMIYQLNNTEMTWKRGVWFRQTGIVPYNRITNVDIVQGPIMRMFKISDVKIQTAGSGAQNQPEIRLNGITDPEPLREMIMQFVRNHGSSSAATGGNDDAVHATNVISNSLNTDLLGELKEIKEILKAIEKK